MPAVYVSMTSQKPLPIYLIQAPFVAAARMHQLWFDALFAPARMERTAGRMVTEKIQALGEAWLQASVQMARESQKLCLAAATGGLTPRMVETAGHRIVRAAERPIAKRVAANAIRQKRNKGRRGRALK